MTNLIPAVDSLYPHLTNALEILHQFELSAYAETNGAVEAAEGSPSFYVGVGDNRCKVILGIETPTSDMTIHFLFDDGSTYQVKGPYSADLLRVADSKHSALTNTDVLNGNLRVTSPSQDGGKPYIIQRGVAILIQDILKLTVEETTPIREKMFPLTSSWR